MNYDSFIFYNEYDIAELRIKELWNVVDRFVIVEMPVTFSGKPKPLLFGANFERFMPYREKIIYLPITRGWPDGFNPWPRESFQRNKQSAFDFRDDDIITISDCDEIPSPSVYSRFDPSQGVGTLEQTFLQYWIDVAVKGEIWRRAKICTGQKLRELGVEGVRIANENSTTQIIPDGGWHLTYIGDADFIRNKISAFSHFCDVGAKEMTQDPDVFRSKDFAAGKIGKIEINDSWPKTILNNREAWRKYECDR